MLGSSLVTCYQGRVSNHPVKAKAEYDCFDLLIIADSSAFVKSPV
jgi:hypothetical protein